jgi:toxin ParE1/3/4
MQIRFSPQALRDLEDIHAFISRDNPEAATRWIARLISSARRAAKTPRAGRMLPEIGEPEIREVLLRTYRIIYRLEPKRVVVLTVLEGRRRLKPFH